MTTAEAIKKLFPNKSHSELSTVWERVYSPQLSAITGKIEINPVILDDVYVEEYGKYEGSLEDDMLKRFKDGENILKALIN